MECQYCKKILSSKSSLNNHQKTVKYCLKIQGKKTQGKFICLCGLDFTVKNSLEKHKQTCTSHSDEVKNLRQQVLLLQQQVLLLENDKKDLQERYAELAKISASKSTTTKNTVNNNLNLGVFDKTESDITKIVEEKYNKEYLINGQRGVAQFTYAHVLEQESGDKLPIYLITDKARGNGKYKVSQTEVVTDIGMYGLTKKVHPSIKKRAIIIATNEDAFNDEELFAGYQEVFSMDDDNSIFKRELGRIIDN